jgi:Bacterial TSP3 repeat
MELLVLIAIVASPAYPAAVSGHLSLSYVPACSLCHVDGKTGSGTANTPFALSARARGLHGGETSLVAGALDALARDGVDSDGDGVTDIRELIAGTDPNVAGGSPTALRADPGFGCSTAAGDVAWTAWLLLAIRRALGRRRTLRLV